MVAENKQIDATTGTATTGHEWDGLTELNTPLPRWWLWLFYVTIIWSIGYWVVYPSWPLLSSYTKGTFGWQSRDALVSDIAGLKAVRGPMMDKLASASVQEIAGDPKLLDFARAVGRAAFGDNCAACHGSGGAGSKGFPNLNDDDWLWGGKLDEIGQTIRHGIRASDPDTRQSAMPAFGREGTLKPSEISAVADYVRTLSKLAPESQANVTLGAKVFSENCAVCHGDDGKGNRELGAPNLTDAIWLYSSDKQTIMEGVTNGRGNVMPAWTKRLDDSTVNALTVYVHTFGGGEK